MSAEKEYVAGVNIGNNSCKGMLILDEMPDCCKKCNFDIISLNENEISCCKLHELVNYEHLCVDGYDDRRHEKCPLTVLPE